MSAGGGLHGQLRPVRDVGAVRGSSQHMSAGHRSAQDGHAAAEHRAEVVQLRTEEVELVRDQVEESAKAAHGSAGVGKLDQ